MNKYFSLVKFSHTVFALPFAIIGFLLAVYYSSYPFEWHLFAKVILCMIFARSAAMAFNRFADKEFDMQNARTSIREIPSGKINPYHALIFVIINVLLFIATAKLINNLCFYLSPVALLVVLGYSYTKRFTFLCHFVLGIGLSLAPIGAYLAVSEEFAWLPLFYSFAVLLWVSGFDIIYALQDEQFDKIKGLFSIPVLLGTKKSLKLSGFLHAGADIFLIIAGIYASFGIWYWVGYILFTGLLIYQHSLVKYNDLSKVNLAFFTTNGIASVVFALFVCLELVLN